MSEKFDKIDKELGIKEFEKIANGKYLGRLLEYELVKVKGTEDLMLKMVFEVQVGENKILREWVYNRLEHPDPEKQAALIKHFKERMKRLRIDYTKGMNECLNRLSEIKTDSKEIHITVTTNPTTGFRFINTYIV